MAHGPVLNDYLGLRLPEEDKEAFIEKCRSYQKPHQEMLREMIVAFNEGRLRITVPKNQLNILKGIHHVD